MTEPTPGMMISLLLTIALIGTYFLNEFTWKREVERTYCNNYILKGIGGFDSLNFSSRVNLIGMSDELSETISAEELVPHLGRHGFREPKGGCGWLDDPFLKDLSDFDTCYLNEVSLKNCNLTYMVIAKFNETKTQLIGSHFQVVPCLPPIPKISKEKLC